MENLITMREAAERLGMSVWTLRKYVRENKIKAIKIGNWKFDVNDVKEFIESKKK